ncbi:MAG: FAD-dependent oxidoreductase [Elusimicrobiaceae bacterium]|nr:FAD-dependent oxidoreductase [Elusimicrobiaceae bacterium]
MTDTDILIIGGGITGLSAAYHLQRLNFSDYLLAEKNAACGGLCGSVRKNGFTYDYSGHLLHLHSGYGKKLVKKLLRGNLGRLSRDTAIFSHGVYTRYPFQANTYGLPPAVVKECVDGFLKAHRADRTVSPDAPFKDWALAVFGPGICRHFMHPYNRKLWQTPLDELTADWCAPFVPRPNPQDVIAGSKADNLKQFGYNADFYYPLRGGCQTLCDALAKPVKNIRTGCELTAIDFIAGTAFFKGLGAVRFKRVINTMPLKKFVKLIKHAPVKVENAAEKLKITSVCNLNAGVARRVSEKHWVYFPEKEFPFYRAGLASNFSPHVAPEGTSSFYIEVSHPQTGRGSRPDLEKIQRAIPPALRRAGLLGPGEKLLNPLWMKLDDAYVVYNRERKPALETIMPYLEKHGCLSIGRYGAWKYSFMEEALLEGRAAAVELAGRLKPVR